MVGLIYVGWIERSPFVKRYTDILDSENIQYEIINWNRYREDSIFEGNIYTYGEKVNHFSKLASKIKPMLNFRKYVKGIIGQKQYDKLVILTTQTAILFPDLISKYKGRYVFDYRDASYEYLRLYKSYVTHVVNNPVLSCISSPGFKEYVCGKSPIVISHNMKRSSYESRVTECKKQEGEKIVMGFVGVLREYDYFCKMIDMFGKDSRFEFNIYGGGDNLDKFIDYAAKYDNVTFFGKYDEKDKDNIISTFDMMCYNYPYTFVNYPAVANKFYDGLIHKKPMYANLDTYSGKIVNDNGVGISIKENDPDTTQKIYDYYMSFSAKEFEEICVRVLRNIIKEDDNFNEKVREAFTN